MWKLGAAGVASAVSRAPATSSGGAWGFRPAQQVLSTQDLCLGSGLPVGWLLLSQFDLLSL